MKTVNAITRIEKELGVKVTTNRIQKNGNAMLAEYAGHELHFSATSNGDAECFYTVKKGADTGYNGFNGTFHESVTSAIRHLLLIAESNAKLIDAAPDLLEALIHVRRHGLIEKEGYDFVVNLVGNAIEKATGQSKTFEAFKIFKEGVTTKGPVQIIYHEFQNFNLDKKVKFYQGLGYQVTDINNVNAKAND